MIRKKALLCLFAFITALLPLAADSPVIEKGILDLSFKDFPDIYPLVGEWEFQNETGGGMLLSVPGGWEEETGYNFGRGVYGLTILNDHRAKGQAALLLTRLWQDIRVYVDGELVFDSINSGNTYLRFTRSIIPIPRDREVRIAIEFENSYFRTGGMHHAILYGPFSQIVKHKYQSMMRESAISGILLLLFLYNLFLYINHYAFKSSLYLSIVSLFFSLRNLFSGEILIEMIFPFEFLVQGALRWNYVFLYMGTVFTLLFIWTIFPCKNKTLNRITKGISVTGVFLAVYAMVASLKKVSSGVYILQGFCIATFLYGLFLMILQLGKKEKDALIIFGGTLVFFSFGIIDIYAVHRGIQLYSLTQPGLLVFILSDFFVLTRRFGKSYLEAERLSRELEQEVALQTSELKQLSRTDPLTGVNNRRRFFELGNRELGIHKRRGRALSLLMLDLDYFKKVNDEYGHSIGDKALIFLTELCLEEVRASDIFGRLGGEEFALILLETELDKAADTAERIRKRLEESTRGRGDGIPPMTVSIGAVCFREGESLDEGLERADDLLYEAKNNGRNRIVAK